MPPTHLGRIRKLFLALAGLWFQMNAEKDFGMKTGMLWKRYVNLGKIVIFIALICPAKDSGRWVQHFKSCSTFDIRGLKLSLKSFEKPSGTATLRLVHLEATLKGKVWNIKGHTASLTGNNSLLERLILCPENLPNLSRIFRADESDRYINKSSAYREALCHRSANTKSSIAITNNRGERAHPCQVPRETGKGSHKMLFVRTEETGSTYSSFTHDVNLGPKPNLSNV